MSLCIIDFLSRRVSAVPISFTTGLRQGPVGFLLFLFYLSIMSIHTPVHKKGIYFITFTCHEWLPLIDRSDSYDAVYNFFKILQNKGHMITGYVIMPNHVHILLYYSGADQSLNTIIGNGKRFMAYEILQRLHDKQEHTLLRILKDSVLKKDAEKGQKHNVWKDSFDVKECRTEKFLLQKLLYMHNNPVSGKWNLAPSALEYVHSSAPFYFNGRQQLFEVIDYRELLNWEQMFE